MIATNGKGNAQETLTYLGCDPGFSANKFACVRSGEMVTYLLPASVGEANRRLQMAFSARRGPGDPAYKSPALPGRFDGIEYLVGPNVSDYTEPIDRLDFNRFKDSPELRATFYAGISRIINSRAHRAAIALALPVKVLAQEAEAEQVEKSDQRLAGWPASFQCGWGRMRPGGGQCPGQVPQPVATWFDWGMDLSGQWVQGKQSQLAPTLVIDQGFNTLDVLLVSGGRISQRFTEGDTLGMRRAAEPSSAPSNTSTGRAGAAPGQRFSPAGRQWTEGWDLRRRAVDGHHRRGPAGAQGVGSEVFNYLDG
ncbi:MAG: hypothetical protein HS126_03340 [Anaerolineales bacterium]|nr:hypothetical protein [Anaerolineales bacterium]